MFDLELIRKYYSNMDEKLTEIRRLGMPLTLTEKILYLHLDSTQVLLM